MNPVFSHDGKTVAYEKGGGGHLHSSLWSRKPGIYLTASKDGTPQFLSASGSRPSFDASGERILLTRRSASKESDSVTLVSIDRHGNDLREHYQSEWATDFQVSPDGKSLALIERFHVFITPFVHAPKPLRVGPETKAIPVVKVSKEAEDDIYFLGGYPIVALESQA